MAFRMSWERRGLCDLPSDILEELCSTVGGMIGGTAELALLSTACRATKCFAASPVLTAMLAVQKGAPQTFWTLRGLALHDELLCLSENHVRFQAGCLTMTPDSLERLSVLATWMHKCPTMVAEVNAHVGSTGATDSKTRRLEVKESCARSDAVAAFLESNGIAASRVVTIGWGSTITGMPSSPMPTDKVRTEVFLKVDDLDFPSRPAYYEGLVPPTQSSSRRRPSAETAAPPSPVLELAAPATPPQCSAEEVFGLKTLMPWAHKVAGLVCVAASEKTNRDQWRGL